jgi:hypothetical protein
VISALILMIVAYMIPPIIPPTNPAENDGDWHYEMNSVIGDRYYVDLNSVWRNGDILHYREKIIYGPQLRLSLSGMFNTPIYKDIGDAQVNCRDMTVQRIHFKAQPIPPESPMAEIFGKLCQSDKLPQEPPKPPAQPAAEE